MFIVTIIWPDDPDRGSETYGPFIDEQAQLEWIKECEEAASLGWESLRGAYYLADKMSKPFDPYDLFQDGS